MGVGVGGDSTGTQAPAERSGWLFWARQAGRPVGGKKKGWLEHRAPDGGYFCLP